MISIIGAGPAGAHYASLAEGDVHLFEEHKEVGNPVACTGILTDSVKRVIDIPHELIISKIEQFKIVAPNGKTTYIDLKKFNMVLDRAKFDQHLVQKALDKGATLHLDERFIGMKKKGKELFFKTTKHTYQTEMLVGADGPFSKVAHAAGIFGKRQLVKGWQARVRYPKLEEGVCEVRMNLGEFSWIVPENSRIARVGVIGGDGNQLRKDYQKLLGAQKILEDQSGYIPVYNPKQKLRKDKVFLLGDAATQVKATTYGGIIYGLLAGNYLADNKKTYASTFNKKLGKDLWMSLKMRNMMKHMTDKQADELITIFNKKYNKEILAQYDRDFPSKFMVQLLMKETKLWKLGLGIMKNKVFA